MEQFNVVLSREIIFFTTMAIGYLAFKFGLLKPTAMDSIADLFTKITLPCMIFINAVSAATREQLLSSLYVIPLHLGTFVVLILGSALLAKAVGLKGDSGRIFRLCCTIGNLGFVGIPIALALFGPQTMIYVALFSFFDHILVWTYGVRMAQSSSLGEERPPLTLRKVINPPIIASLLSVIFILLEIKLPKDLSQAFSEISAAGLPLPFLYIGGMLCGCDLKKLFRQWPVYLFIFAKMLVFPVIVFVVFRAINVPAELRDFYIIVAGLPALALAPMLARMGKSDETLATALTSISTVASLVCIPAVSYICSALL